MSVYYVNAAPETDTELKDDEQQRDSQSPVQSEALTALNAFWPKVMEDIKKINYLDLKQQALPLARIKKIMKLDEDVKMISAEAPMLFAKAAEIFIYELTLRAWIHTEDNKRRTLQRNDIAMAITKFDQFDFLIDIVPRDEIKSSKPREDGTVRTSMNPDQVHYYFQLAQQHQQALQQTATTQSIAGTHPIQIVQPQQMQTIAVNSIDQTTATNSTGSSPTQVLIQQSPTNTAATTSPQNGNIQIIQQVITPSGEVQQIPIQLTQQQLQMIRMQVQGANSNQPIIIQAAPIQTANTQTPQLIQVSQQANSGPVFLTHANSNATTEPE